MGTPDYVIITPVRNEGPYLGKTIDSVVSQTLRPSRWILVNDGSSDNTAQLIEEAARSHSWIEALHRPDRGFRKPGGGVIEAFCAGLNLLDGDLPDYLAKLDGDLSFDRSYFESSFARFDTDEKLGIGGGTVCSEVNGVLQAEAPGDPLFHVRGATKIYRRACWEAIGGLAAATGWDTLDEVKANMLGWRTYTFAELRVLQLKKTGSADGVWKNYVKNGLANYATGYHPLFMLCKCLRRLREKPYGVVAVALGYGFVSGYLSRTPRVAGSDVVRYVRRQQLRRLVFKSSIWTIKQGNLV